jgi:hypothetical protein
MKTKDFDSFSPIDTRTSRPSRRVPQGMGPRSVLLGLACGAGVFAVLTLLYHFG